MNLILLGAPGAGKGTQAQQLDKRLGVPQVSTGDMLRKALREETALGKRAQAYMESGDLVPDELVVAIVRERLSAADCAGGFILDGFPRTVAQAEALENSGVSVDHVLNFEVPEEELIRRLTGRRSCADCGAMYHVVFNPPSREGICDRCGGRNLIQRADDNEETARSRLGVYAEKTEPLIKFYGERGLRRDIDGTGDQGHVLARTLEVLEA